MSTSSNKKSKDDISKDSSSKEPSPEEIEFSKLSQLYDNYISYKKLYVKYASLLNIDRIMYVKGKDFKQFFAENFQDLKKNLKEISNFDLGEKPTIKTLQKFYAFNREKNIMHYLQRVPGDKAKYPKRLLPLKKTDDLNKEYEFSDNGFYSVKIKIEKSNKPVIYLGILIILILLIVMFPIWPLSVKIGAWWVLFGILVFLIAFLILSILVVIVGILFGYDIYILPNIDEYRKTWYDRFFNPFVAYEDRKDPLWFKIIRILSGISIVLLGVIAYFYPDIPKYCFGLFKGWFTWSYSYIRDKIVSMHNNRNAVKIRDRQYFENLDDI